jgi:hypothetical protein
MNQGHTSQPDHPDERHRPERTFRADARIDPCQLTPGTEVRRYTEPGRGTALFVPVPCCDRVATLHHATHHSVTIVCDRCGQLYTTTLIPECDGGYAALLEVGDTRVTFARRPRTRRQLRSVGT